MINKRVLQLVVEEDSSVDIFQLLGNPHRCDAVQMFRLPAAD